MEDKELKMSFEPRTIEHLGVKMYSHVPPALAELIANSYDACATRVDVKLYDIEEKKIVVVDNGTGMSFDEVNEHFLKIGRNRREQSQESGCDRTATGKKGLGKLALFGLGNKITIITRKDGVEVEFILDYNEIKEWDNGDYTPSYKLTETTEPNGTTLKLEQLNRVTGFPVENYAISISKLFNFKAPDFELYISLNDLEPILVDNKLKYDNIKAEFKWDYNEISSLTDSEYSYKEQISGELLTTEKPLIPGSRGITLFSNGRMVNAQEFFGAIESSHFFSYATGWLDVDFIDDMDEDLISTDRQSINWEHKIAIDLKEFLILCLKALEKDWRGKRKVKKIEKINEKTNINVNEWFGNLPPEIRTKLEPVIASIVENSQLPENETNQVVSTIHEFVPDYPYFHWRHLHSEVQNAAKTDYENRDFYRAFTEAAKRYITETRTKSSSTNASDSGMMGSVYGRGGTLSVTHSYLKPDGTPFQPDTLGSIEDGQKFLSMGIVAGGRNPVSHELIADLRDSGLFSEKDCLDGLSLLSHLYRRLEDS